MNIILSDFDNDFESNQKMLNNIELNFVNRIDEYFNNKNLKYRKYCLITWDKWCEWCDAHGVHKLYMSPENIKSFINSFTHYRNATKKIDLSHMRTFLTLLYSASNGQIPIISHWYSLKDSMLKATTVIGKDKQVPRRPIPSINQVVEMLKMEDDESLYSLRWKSIICLLFFAGMRLNELSKLEWDDIDFDKHEIRPKHAKYRNEEPVLPFEVVFEVLTQFHDKCLEELGFLPKYLLIRFTRNRNIISSQFQKISHQLRTS